ncbi:MAG: fucose isomerase [Clostridia bacterium]|nr:fucose isomerase [Clostridia bacterium]
MLSYNVKIGLLPMRRNTNDRPKGTFLTWYSAEERGKRFVDYIEKNFSGDKVSFVDSKGIGIKDLVFDDDSAEKVTERFKSEKVDAVFIINCNFGNEEAAADIAKALGVPVLLWAPLDDEYYVDGMRPTDSQCGLFGVSRQMQRFHIPFSHLPCCKVESEEFKSGFDSFVRVACMVKNFKGIRVGQIGLRPAPFYSVMWNEGDLIEKFGVKMIPINFALIEQRMKAVLAENPPEKTEIENYILKNYKLDDLTPQYVERMAAYTITVKRLFDEFNLDAISAECWTATPVMFDGLAPCTVYGILGDMGYLVSCESDMHALLTMVLLKCATLGEGKPLFGEFTVRHPENKNAELLWHCGPFPLSQKAESGIDSTARLVNQRSWFRAKDGEYTVARIDREDGKYMILPLLANTTTGPQTHGTYLWAQFSNLQKIEDRLLDGPYIHHFVEIAGDWRKEIKEFCKYFPNLSVDGTLL